MDSVEPEILTNSDRWTIFGPQFQIFLFNQMLYTLLSFKETAFENTANEIVYRQPTLG